MGGDGVDAEATRELAGKAQADGTEYLVRELIAELAEIKRSAPWSWKSA